MAEIHGIFCRPFLPSVLIIEEVDGMGDGEGWVGWAAGWGGTGGVGGVGGGKKPCLGHPMSSHNAHTMANETHQWAT